MPQIQITDNRKVARNTVFLYVRMILILGVTLYTSRIVLDVLGVDDYGIYNVVGGVVTMFAFLSNSMASSTQRYLTYELGRNDPGRLRTVFSAARHIHLVLGLVLVALLETVGLWFLNDRLVIDTERMAAARWVFQFSVLTFFVNVLQVPYNAVIIAHEKMGIYAYVSVAEVVAKLVLVFLLKILPYDKLILYGLLMLLVQVAVRLFYQFWCRSRYAECHPAPVRDRQLYREMSGFAGWNVLGSLAWIMKDQGVNILLNLFFGTAVNAARGIAAQVSYSVNSFVNNFQIAFNPQITKNYACGQTKEMERLALRGLKFSFMLLYFMALPLLLNVDFILDVWLKEVPDHAASFIVLIMCDALVCSFSGSPLMTSLAATGRIRNYQVTVSVLIMLTLPVSYFLFRAGAHPETVYYVMIFFSAVSGFVRFLFAKHQIGFSLAAYFRTVLLRSLAVVCISLPVPLLLRIAVFPEDSMVSFLVLCLACVSCTGAAVWYAGLDSIERPALVRMLADFLRKAHIVKAEESMEEDNG